MSLTNLLKTPIAKLSVTDAERDLATAQKALTAATDDVAAAKQAYQAVLLSADDAALKAADEKRLEADRMHDRAKAVVAALKERLEAVLARDEQAERRKAYDEAKALAQAAAARLKREYEKAAQTVVGIIRDLAAADLAVLAVNAALPTGAERLALPESQVRDAPATTPRVVKDRIVSRLVYEVTGNILSDDDARRVIKAGGQSYMPREQHAELPIAGGLPIVVERTFREVTEELPLTTRDIPRLASAVSLPSLLDVTELWSPLQPTWQGLAPEDVLAHGDELAAARSVEERQSIDRRFRVRLEPVDEAEVDTIREARRA